MTTIVESRRKRTFALEDVLFCAKKYFILIMSVFQKELYTQEILDSRFFLKLLIPYQTNSKQVFARSFKTPVFTRKANSGRICRCSTDLCTRCEASQLNLYHVFTILWEANIPVFSFKMSKFPGLQLTLLSQNLIINASSAHDTFLGFLYLNARVDAHDMWDLRSIEQFREVTEWWKDLSAHF
jgi:hypothetical protein